MSGVGSSCYPSPVTRLLMFVGSTVGSAIGWWIGNYIGIMTAWAVSFVGFGLGMYLGRRLAIHWDAPS